MQIALLRTAVSVIVKEGEDGSTGLFTVDGEIISQAASSPLHLASMGPAIRSIIAEYPIEAMESGDVYILNDPYSGGSHLPDLITMMPVFNGHRVIAFSVGLAHHEDVGGKTQGSMPADSTEIFQEGLILAPLPLYKAGKPNDTLFNILRSNVRMPDTLLGDLDAQIAAIKVGARGISEVVEGLGVESFLLGINQLFDLSESRVRKRIEAMPDGRYEFREWIDDDGINRGERLVIECGVTIDGSDVAVDFTGTAPQATGPVNCNLFGTTSAVHCALRSITDPFAPPNEGAMRGVKVSVPTGTLLNPNSMAPVCLRAQTAKRVADVVFGTMAQAVPEASAAGYGGALSVYSFGGKREDGSAFGCTDLVACGFGARPDRDGVDLIEGDITNSQLVPSEAFEASFPLRVLRSTYRTDSGGAGEHRGGLGVERAIEILDGPLQSCFRSDRFESSPWGLLGGKPGRRHAARVERAEGTVDKIASREIVTLRTGDVFVLETGGGGGYGDPLKRCPEKVFSDVLDRKVSLESARDDYGVVFKNNHRAIDSAATEDLRQRLYAKRGPIEWTFDRDMDGRF
jgi:N-methylhydantoinase B